MPSKKPPREKKLDEMTDKERVAAGEQHKRFKETAREHGADESGKAFEDAFGKIVPPKKT